MDGGDAGGFDSVGGHYGSGPKSKLGLLIYATVAAALGVGVRIWLDVWVVALIFFGCAGVFVLLAFTRDRFRAWSSRKRRDVWFGEPEDPPS